MKFMMICRFDHGFRRLNALEHNAWYDACYPVDQLKSAGMNPSAF